LSEKWMLPEIVGGEWHRPDFTKDMLVGGYRPLLLDEDDHAEDDYLREDYFGDIDRVWKPLGGFRSGQVKRDWNRRRTKRPLPDGVSYDWKPLHKLPILPAKRRRLLEL